MKGVTTTTMAIVFAVFLILISSALLVASKGESNKILGLLDFIGIRTMTAFAGPYTYTDNGDTWYYYRDLDCDDRHCYGVHFKETDPGLGAYHIYDEPVISKVSKGTMEVLWGRDNKIKLKLPSYLEGDDNGLARKDMELGISCIDDLCHVLLTSHHHYKVAWYKISKNTESSEINPTVVNYDPDENPFGVSGGRLHPQSNFYCKTGECYTFTTYDYQCIEVLGFCQPKEKYGIIKFDMTKDSPTIKGVASICDGAWIKIELPPRVRVWITHQNGIVYSTCSGDINGVYKTTNDLYFTSMPTISSPKISEKENSESASIPGILLGDTCGGDDRWYYPTVDCSSANGHAKCIVTRSWIDTSNVHCPATGSGIYTFHDNGNDQKFIDLTKDIQDLNFQFSGKVDCINNKNRISCYTPTLSRNKMSDIQVSIRLAEIDLERSYIVSEGVVNDITYDSIFKDSNLKGAEDSDDVTPGDIGKIICDNEYCYTFMFDALIKIRRIR